MGTAACPVCSCVDVLHCAVLLCSLQAHNISSPPARTASFGGGAGGNERSGSGGVARRAADAITNLAHENLEIKNMVRWIWVCDEQYSIMMLVCVKRLSF
jgi:hypothetical protein